MSRFSNPPLPVVDNEPVIYRFPDHEAPKPRREHPALGALNDVSRRMDVLARQLGCLGFFDTDGDGPPRAA